MWEVIGITVFQEICWATSFSTALIQQSISGLHIRLTIYRSENIDRDARASVYAPYPFVFGCRLVQNRPNHSLDVDHRRIFDQGIRICHPSVFQFLLIAHISPPTQHSGSVNFQIKFKILVNRLIKPSFCFHFSTPKFSSRVSGYPQFPRDTLHGPSENSRGTTSLLRSGHAPARPHSPLSSRQGAGVTSGQPSASLRCSGPSPQFLQTFSHCFLSLGHGSLP